MVKYKKLGKMLTLADMILDDKAVIDVLGNNNNFEVSSDFMESFIGDA